MYQKKRTEGSVVDEIFLMAGFWLFISISQKEIPGDAQGDEARKGNPKKDILINVKKLHGFTQVSRSHVWGYVLVCR
jgi:hypothetical protein